MTEDTDKNSKWSVTNEYIRNIILAFLLLAGFTLCCLYSLENFKELRQRIDQNKETILHLNVKLEKIIFSSRNRNHGAIFKPNTHRVARRSVKSEVEEKNREIKRLGDTIYSLRREMFSLNDRLRKLLSFNGESALNQRGESGSPGKIGPPGSPGINGRDGYHGVKGEPGPQGPQGENGNDGLPGNDGMPGLNGVPGIPGFMGSKGSKGLRGRDGLHGINGAIGLTGRQGIQGRPGKPGEKGETGNCEIIYRDTVQKTVQQSDENDIKNAVYTVWGSSTCPGSSDIIYSGQLSMSKFRSDEHKFIGSNPICMPISNRRNRRFKRDIFQDENLGEATNPNLDQGLKNKNYNVKLNERNITLPNPSKQTSIMRTQVSPSKSSQRNLKTTEKFEPNVNKTKLDKPIKLQTLSNENSSQNKTTPLPKHKNDANKNKKKKVTKKDQSNSSNTRPSTSRNVFEPDYGFIESTRKYVSCALCNSEQKSLVIMVPSRTQCPTLWSEEYQGYLMMYHHGSGQSTSICVNDQALGVSPSSDEGIRHIISSYLSHVKIDCTSFPCPPFYEQLTKCVVCSK